MRDGISRDGRHLYPAFPYTAFTRTTDDDLSALYAYLMAQPAVAVAPPPTRLAFPFSLRPLMALWNALYLTPGPQPADPARTRRGIAAPIWSKAWAIAAPATRPRNALGAERGGRGRFAGALVDGWEAPPLAGASAAAAAGVDRDRAVPLSARRPLTAARQRERPDGAGRA